MYQQVSDVISANDLRTLVSYNPTSGRFLWLERDVKWFVDERQCRSWNSRWAGKEAFPYADNHGYFGSSICGRRYKAHRVAWAVHYGEWPSDHIDHINGDRSDNRIENLRLASAAENQWNRSKSDGKSSKYKGVSFDSWTGKWVVRIRVNGKSLNGGRFSNQKDAAMRYNELSKFYFGEFAKGNPVI